MRHKKKRTQYDPRWIMAKFGYCNICGKNLKNQHAWYYPGSHDIFCEECAKPYVEEFNKRGEYVEEE